MSLMPLSDPISAGRTWPKSPCARWGKSMCTFLAFHLFLSYFFQVFSASFSLFGAAVADPALDLCSEDSDGLR